MVNTARFANYFSEAQVQNDRDLLNEPLLVQELPPYVNDPDDTKCAKASDILACLWFPVSRGST
jgi:hypothetical protein